MNDREINGCCRRWQSHLVIPLESFAGKDLLSVYTEDTQKGGSRGEGLFRPNSLR